MEHAVVSGSGADGLLGSKNKRENISQQLGNGRDEEAEFICLRKNLHLIPSRLFRPLNYPKEKEEEKIPGVSGRGSPPRVGLVQPLRLQTQSAWYARRGVRVGFHIMA